MPRNTLVVGAHAQLIDLLKEMLVDGEREVRTALSGASAIEQMSQRLATTVVIDDDLHDFSGSNLAFHLKAVAQTHTPAMPCCIIALRGDLDSTLKTHSVPGFDYVLVKPLAIEQIEAFLRTCDVDLIRTLAQRGT